MSKTSLFLAPLVSLFAGSAIANDGVECHPDSKKIEWHVCVLKEVEYKRGMKTETRRECAVNKKLDVKGCNLGDIMSYLPEGEDVEGFQIYALGPVDFDDNLWESQEVHDSDGCKVQVRDLELYQLMKFSDAFDKSNRERGEMVEENLKKKGKMLIPRATLAPWKFPGADCAGKTSKAGRIDVKSQSKFLFFAETAFK